MRKFAVWGLSFLLLIFAMMPWLFCGFQPRSLMPNDLRQERNNYDATVSMAQNQTSEAMRQSTSIISVSTVQATPDQNNIRISLTETPVPESKAPTSTVMVLVITSSEEDASTSIPTPGSTLAAETQILIEEPTLVTPIGMVDRTDVITEAKFVEQLEKDAKGSNITGITVTITPGDVEINSNISVLPGLVRKAVAKGTFAVKDDSLVMAISSIKFGDVDVTDQYARKLESRLNTSLYRLLPQRFVQRFTPLDGQVEVLSKVRP